MSNSHFLLFICFAKFSLAIFLAISGRCSSRSSRTFSIAAIKVLVWGATGFDQKFQSSKFAGYISDFYVGDIDNDGKKEIVYAVVSKSGMFSSKKTVIYTYNLY